MMLRSSAGLTLVELMLALALGLLVMTAATRVLIDAQRHLQRQMVMGELQQNAYLGFELLAHDIRQINQNIPSQQRVNLQDLGSGIIFTQANLPKSMTQNMTAWMTQQDLSEAGTVQKSDQLLIQYIPEYQTVGTQSASSNLATTKAVISAPQSTAVDCEGRQIEFAAQTNEMPRIIVNRYFLAPDPQQEINSRVSYSLFCESGWYQENDRQITGLNGGGQQLIKAVEAFKIRLGVQDVAGQLAYMSINQYRQLMAKADLAVRYHVVSIEVALLLRAHAAMPADQKAMPIKTYLLAGQSLQLKQVESSPQNDRVYQRISRVIALRNAQGVQRNE